MVKMGKGNTIGTEWILVLVLVSILWLTGCVPSASEVDSGDPEEEASEEIAMEESSPEDEKVEPREPEWAEVVVPVGENPPAPDQAGAHYVQVPDVDVKSGAGVIWGLELALFGERWNEAAGGLDRPDLYIDEFVVRYQEDEMFFYQDMEAWSVWGEICYEKRFLTGAGMDWKKTGASYDDAIASAWEALVYATDADIMMEGQLALVLEELGIKDQKPTELGAYESDALLWELWYEFRAEENRGVFLVLDEALKP